MKVFIEYTIYNIEIGEISNFAERVMREHNNKYGYISWYEVYEKTRIEFFDKLKNNTKNVWVEGKRVTYCAGKRELASKGRYKMNKINKLIITLVGEIQKNVINTYMKLRIPMFWIHLFKNIANNREYVYNYCNRPPNKFDRYCRECYLYNLVKNNTDGDEHEDDIQTLDDGMNNYALQV